jgi:hypothetical protein
MLWLLFGREIQRMRKNSTGFLGGECVFQRNKEEWVFEIFIASI